jgi:hypothetical protein
MWKSLGNILLSLIGICVALMIGVYFLFREDTFGSMMCFIAAGLCIFSIGYFCFSICIWIWPLYYNADQYSTFELFWKYFRSPNTRYIKVKNQKSGRFQNVECPDNWLISQLSSFVLGIVIFFCFWQLQDMYRLREFMHYAKGVKGVVYDKYRGGKSGRQVEYRYQLSSGIYYGDYHSDSLQIGDSIMIMYSSRRPEMHEVMTPSSGPK